VNGRTSTQPDGDRSDGRQKATGDGTGHGAGGTGANETSDNTGRSASEEANGQEGNEDERKADMTSLTRERAGSRPTDGHTQPTEARAQKNVLVGESREHPPVDTGKLQSRTVDDARPHRGLARRRYSGPGPELGALGQMAWW
jgi:hypothetical protein